jgi:hypothetical protein
MNRKTYAALGVAVAVAAVWYFIARHPVPSSVPATSTSGLPAIQPSSSAVPPMSRGISPAAPPLRGTPGATPQVGPIRTMAAIDLNSAPVEALQTLPGNPLESARKIVAGRPYRDRSDLERAGLPHDLVEKLGPPAMIRGVDTLKAPGRGGAPR